MKSEQWFTLIELALLALTLLATVAAALFVAYQTQRHFALQRSQEFIERFNAPETKDLRRRVDRWLASGQPARELLEQVRQESEAQAEPAPASEIDADLTIVANFFQELGTAMRFKTLDRAYTWGVFGGLVQRYWRNLQPYVNQVRYDMRRKTLFEDFEWLHAEMLKLDQRRGVVDKGSVAKEEPPIYLFGYGSLFSPASIQHTAGRPFEKSDLIMTWLDGYRRGWSIHDDVVFDGEEAATSAVFYNLVPDPEAHCNGVLIPVTEEDLIGFDRRERRYDRVDVTAHVTPCPPGRVVTYVGRSRYTELPAGAVIPAKYEALVADAVRDWGDPLERDFTATTDPSELPRKSGAYRFLPAPGV